jgi:hypothetical protein
MPLFRNLQRFRADKAGGGESIIDEATAAADGGDLGIGIENTAADIGFGG